MATLFVDTASTAGGTGTTSALSGANRAFATLLEAVNSLPATLTTQTTINCAASTGVADTTPVNQAPWDMVTTAANYLLIQGNNRTGKYQTAAPYYRMEVTNPSPGAIYNNLVAHWRIDGVQVKLTATSGTLVGIKGTNANQTETDIDVRISNCIVWGVPSGGSVIGFENRWPAVGANGTLRVMNCLAIKCTTGFSSDWDGAGGHYNCTNGQSAFGFNDNQAVGPRPGGNNSTPMRVFNCLSVSSGSSIGFVGLFGSGGTSSDYNAEDDGNGIPGGGTHNRSLTTFSLVNKAGDDYHLLSTDAGARNFGTDNPTSGIYLDDVDGQTRVSPWDIGFDEYVLVVASGEAESNYFIWSDRRR